MGPVTRSQIKSIAQALNTPRNTRVTSASTNQSSFKTAPQKFNQNSSKRSPTRSISSCSCTSCSCEEGDSDYSTSSSCRSREKIRSRSPIARSRSNSNERSTIKKNAEKSNKSDRSAAKDNNSQKNNRGESSTDKNTYQENVEDDQSLVMTNVDSQKSSEIVHCSTMHNTYSKKKTKIFPFSTNSYKYSADIYKPKSSTSPMYTKEIINPGLSSTQKCTKSQDLFKPGPSSAPMFTNSQENPSSTMDNPESEKKIRYGRLSTIMNTKPEQNFDNTNSEDFGDDQSTKSSSSSQANSVRTYSTYDYEESSNDSRVSPKNKTSSQGSSSDGRPSVISRATSKSGNFSANRPSVICRADSNTDSKNANDGRLSSASKSSFSSVISKASSEDRSTSTTMSLISNVSSLSSIPVRRTPSPRTIHRNSMTNLVSMRGSPVSNVCCLLGRRYLVFACPENECNVVSTRVRTVTEHHKHKHPKRLHLYYCYACRERFATREVLDIHRIGEHNEQAKCTLCNCMFPGDPYLREHARMHQRQRIKCDTCSVPLMGPCHLAAHTNAVNRIFRTFNPQPHSKSLCKPKKIYILERYERRETKVDFNLPGAVLIEREPVRDVAYIRSFCNSNKCCYEHKPWRLNFEQKQEDY